MRLRRILAPLGIAGLLGVLLPAVVVAPAQADDTCVDVLHLPPRWGLSPTTDGSAMWGSDDIYMAPTGACSDEQGAFYDRWHATGDGGIGTAYIEMEMESCGAVLSGPGGAAFSTPPPVGRLTFTGTGESECDQSPIAVSDATMDVRVTSTAAVTASRSGKKVTITAGAKRYYTSTGNWGSWDQAFGVIQYRTSSTAAWQGLKYATTSNGTYRYTYTTSAKRQYRVLWPNVQYVWGSASAASGTV